MRTKVYIYYHENQHYKTKYMIE